METKWSEQRKKARKKGRKENKIRKATRRNEGEKA